MQKINKGLIWALLLSLPLTAIGKISNVNDDILPGDVDGDGKVTKEDVTAAIDIALSKSNTNGYNVSAADFNGDGKVTITDAVAIARYVIAKNSNGTHNGHEYVNLDLPSGILWATCNVGAENSEDIGDSYAWGETETKESYSSDNYKYLSSGKYTKYTLGDSSSYNGLNDGKRVLEPEDDVAHVLWGGNWRMPTYEEANELIVQCTWTWTTLNGRRGYIVTGRNGNFIFLPNGIIWGKYWLSTLYSNSSSSAYELYICESYFSKTYRSRYGNEYVRPVCQMN